MPQIYLRDGAEEFMGLLNDWSVFGKTLNIGSFAGNVSLAFVFFNLKYDKGPNRLKTCHSFYRELKNKSLRLQFKYLRTSYFLKICSSWSILVTMSEIKILIYSSNNNLHTYTSSSIKLGIRIIKNPISTVI